MDFSSATSKLKSLKQSHLLNSWPSLDTLQRKYLLNQIDMLDEKQFILQKSLLEKNNSTAISFENLMPIEYRAEEDGEKAREAGEKALSQGKVGVLIMAGGQGSRLGFSAPKGCYPISVIKQKSFFQIYAEKALAAEKKWRKVFPLAILCSPQNVEQTKDFFLQNQLFGLSKQQLFFFTQSQMPLLDENGQLFLSDTGQIAMGAEGNGTLFYHFEKAQLRKKWGEKGVEYVTVIQIDNPLADPFDAKWIGKHLLSDNQISIKCIERNHAEEKLGLIVQQEDNIRVIEYSEMPADLSQKKDAHGKLLYSLGNISQFCLNLNFIPKLAEFLPLMPLHLAYKKSKNFEQKEIRNWKFERYIFDVLPATKNIGLFLCPRELCFYPLKDASGPYGPEGVRKALQDSDRRIFASISGLKAPDFAFELAQQFHYPTLDLLQKWHNKEIREAGYIQEY